MNARTPPPKPKPDRITGLAHVFAATNYSLAGLRRLWRETAFRHEVLLLAGALVLFTALGATLAEFFILLGIFCLLVAVEALNTALECIVDHLSPEWEEYARDAKDLGSLAVMCIVILGAIFVGHVLLGRLLGTA